MSQNFLKIAYARGAQQALAELGVKTAGPRMSAAAGALLGRLSARLGGAVGGTVLGLTGPALMIPTIALGMAGSGLGARMGAVRTLGRLERLLLEKGLMKNTLGRNAAIGGTVLGPIGAAVGASFSKRSITPKGQAAAALAALGLGGGGYGAYEALSDD